MGSGNLHKSFLEGISCFKQGKLSQAKHFFLDIVTADPLHADALHMLGLTEASLQDAQTAALYLQRAVQVSPNQYLFNSNLALALNNIGQYQSSLQYSLRASELNPNYANSYFHSGVSLAHLKRIDEAIDFYSKALLLLPQFTDALSNRALLYKFKGMWSSAAADLTFALSFKPEDVMARLELANVWADAKQPTKALEIYEQVLQLSPDLALAHFQKAKTLETVRDYSLCLEHYKRAYDIDPSLPFLKGSLLHSKMLVCDWIGLIDLAAEIEHDLENGLQSATPFGYQAIATDEALLKKCAEIYCQSFYPTKEDPLFKQHRTLGDKQSVNSRIKLGYLCGEFREHATAMLMTEVWELHDRNRFELFAFDNGWSDVSARRHRIEAAFDHIVDISKLSDEQASKIIADLEIDILVNLNGYFGLGRPGVFAHQPAPAQVNFLGFPGTTGASYMDFLIADTTIIPDESRQHYSEKIMYLSGCYQANDSLQQASLHSTRKELGLPEGFFIYCCFNNNYKLTPQIFNLWMRILLHVPRSVLWLLEDNILSKHNLQKEAMARGVSIDRLIFAQRLPNDQHLARHLSADLFLDTLPYNAHTGASDALRMNLPILTMTGTTFPGRVATSLLNTLGCSELVCTTEEEYFKKAVYLASDSKYYYFIKNKITYAVKNSFLYNSFCYCKKLEKCFLAIFELTA